MSEDGKIVAARLARARQSNKESGREQVVLTGAAMHGSISQPHAAAEGAASTGEACSSSAGATAVGGGTGVEQLDPQQQQMLAQMELAQQELERNQQRLEQQRLEQQLESGASVMLATAASLSDPDAPNVPAEWLLRPAERGAPMVQCLVKRERSGLGFYPIYRMFLQKDDGDVFVLAARRRKGVMSEGHSFLISRDPKDLEKGPNYVGKLRSNLIGCACCPTPRASS